jgi:hypothetical protein
MSKFTSFLVFSFGLFLIGVVMMVVARKHFFADTKPAEPKMTLPACDLPPLETASREEFEKNLDLMFESGGIEAIKRYAEKEFVLGRVVHVDWPQPDGVGETRVVDREIRPCDLNGTAELQKPPILPRLVVAQTMGDGVFLATWTRVDVKKQFVLNLWLYRPKK